MFFIRAYTPVSPYLPPSSEEAPLPWQPTLKRKTFNWALLTFRSLVRGLVHYHCGRKQETIQAYIVLKKKLRVLHLDLTAARRN